MQAVPLHSPPGEVRGAPGKDITWFGDSRESADRDAMGHGEVEGWGDATGREMLKYRETWSGCAPVETYGDPYSLGQKS